MWAQSGYAPRDHHGSFVEEEGQGATLLLTLGPLGRPTGTLGRPSLGPLVGREVPPQALGPKEQLCTSVAPNLLIVARNSMPSQMPMTQCLSSIAPRPWMYPSRTSPEKGGKVQRCASPAGTTSVWA